MTQEADVAAEGLQRVRDQAVNRIERQLARCERPRDAARRVATLALHRRSVLRDMAGELLRGGWTRAYSMALTATHPTDLSTPKVVSPKYRCVWFSCPKVASRSILSVLLAADPDCKVYAMSAADLYRLRPDASEWFRFAFVRNPLDRALSCWFELHVAPRYCSDRIDPLVQKRDHLFRRYHGLADTHEFDVYCDWLNTPYAADESVDQHFVSMDPQLRDDRGRLPNFIGQLEEIERDWRHVAVRLGLPVRELPLLHTGIGWEATLEDVRTMRASRAELLTARNRGLLAKRYAKDMKLGEYSPKAALQ